MTEVGKQLAAALLQLVMDLSGGDTALVEKTKAIIANPPTTVEEIGFYGMEEKPADERALRATLFQLSEAGHILGFEDKYIYEMPDVLIQNGHLPKNHGSAALTAFSGPALGGLSEEAEEDGDVARELAKRFPPAAKAIEELFKAQGKRLLYIDMPLGDTLHYIIVTPKVAAMWENVKLYQTEDGVIAVTAPNWSDFWDFFSYAVNLKRDAPEPDLPSQAAPKLRSLQEAGF